MFKTIEKFTRTVVKVADKQTFVFIAALTSFCWAMFSASLFAIIDSPPIGIFLWTELGIIAKLAALQSNAEPFIQEET